MKIEQLYGGPLDGLETAASPTTGELTAVTLPQDVAGVPTWTLGTRKRHSHRVKYIRRNGRFVFAEMKPQQEATSWA